ncbi:MAG: glutathione S-transferase family protein [Rickettsiales bacterium]
MIKLYGFGEAFGLPDASPFVTKVELLLKIANIDYEIDVSGFSKAPKGKLPYIDDGGVIISDSTFIRFYLEEKYSVNFGDGLSDKQKSVAWAVEKMLEDNLYFTVLDARWGRAENFEKIAKRFFGGVPALVRPFIKNMVRKKVMKTLNAQGMGRHSLAEREKLAQRDLQALSDIIGDNKYLMGDSVCAADATVFAFVSGVLCKEFITEIRDFAEKLPNLIAYNDRMIKEYYT